MHRAWHANVVDNPLFWSDRKRQMDRCREKYKGGTIFYGSQHAHKLTGRFEIENDVVTYTTAKQQQEVVDRETRKAIELRAKCKESGECAD